MPWPIPWPPAPKSHRCLDQDGPVMDSAIGVGVLKEVHSNKQWSVERSTEATEVHRRQTVHTSTGRSLRGIEGRNKYRLSLVEL